MEWYWIVGIVLYGVGALVWLIVFIIGTVDDAKTLRREERYLSEMRPAGERYAKQQLSVEEANAIATWTARMLLLFPLWLPVLIFSLLRKFVRVLKPFMLLVAPSLDKAAKQRKADKEKADAQARLYPTER